MIGKSTPRLLPKTGAGQVVVADGAICAQMVRCGKPNCRCARGGLHGPYFYRFTRDPCGRLRKQYVRREEVGEWREMCQRRREYLAGRALMRELARRAVRGGRVNMGLAERVLAMAVRTAETEIVTPDGEGLRRALINIVRDAAALIDLSQALRGKPTKRAVLK